MRTAKTGSPFLLSLVVCLAHIATASPALTGEPPRDWFLAGSNPPQYETGTTTEVRQSGNASAYLASKSAEPEGFGTLMQAFAADLHRGKRVRLSGYVKPESVADWVGLWMRVDGPDGQVLSFDNMHDRPIEGTSAWRKVEIVLDVPEQSELIAFGILPTGRAGCTSIASSSKTSTRA
jgi:hypothetical protein